MQRRRRRITGRRLGDIVLAASGLPEILRTTATPRRATAPRRSRCCCRSWPLPEVEPIERSLAEWMGQRLPAIAALEPTAQAEAVLGPFARFLPGLSFLLNKLLTGGLRVGVSQGLVARALARPRGGGGRDRPPADGGPSPSRVPQPDRPARGAEEPAAGPIPSSWRRPLDPVAAGRRPATGRLEWKWDGSAAS